MVLRERIGVTNASHDTKKQIGNGIGRFERFPAFDNVMDHTPQILHQHYPQRDCRRPEFTDRKYFALLTSDNEAPECCGIEAAVSMSDVSPRYAEDPRVTSQRASGQFWQLAIVARWQVFTNLLSSKRPGTWRSVSRWAAARLAACSSIRSMLNSSSRIMRSLLHGDSGLPAACNVAADVTPLVHGSFMRARQPESALGALPYCQFGRQSLREGIEGICTLAHT